jgi:hypothetical protein
LDTRIAKAQIDTADSLRKLINLLPNPSTAGEGQRNPIILLHIDESETTQCRLLSDTKSRTNYSCLTRAIDSLKAEPLLTVFTSTASRLYELAPPQLVHSSDRVVENDVIPLPFWELPFDVNIGVIGRGSMKLEEVTEIAHLVKFGRPL